METEVSEFQVYHKQPKHGEVALNHFCRNIGVGEVFQPINGETFGHWFIFIFEFDDCTGNTQDGKETGRKERRVCGVYVRCVL